MEYTTSVRDLCNRQARRPMRWLVILENLDKFLEKSLEIF